VAAALSRAAAGRLRAGQLLFATLSASRRRPAGGGVRSHVGASWAVKVSGKQP
jgi:hypothetical protein